MKTIAPPQTGKLGDMVASRNSYGPHLRKHFQPRKGHSPAQRNAWELFGLLAACWECLTEAQRLLWHRAAEQTPSRRRLGTSHRLLGSVLFQKVNYPRLLIGLEPLFQPSIKPEFPPNPVCAFAARLSPRGLRLELSLADSPTQDILVYGSPPCKAGRSSCSTFCLLGLLPAPCSGLCDITRLYCRRYGLPPLGSRIFIRTRQQINGWQDAFRRVDALVGEVAQPAPWPARLLAHLSRPMK